jgi:hypothetical protein
MVVCGQVRREQSHGGQAQGTVGESIEDDRESARGAGDLDAV